jgi:hypothetical protein
MLLEGVHLLRVEPWAVHDEGLAVSRASDDHVDRVGRGGGARPGQQVRRGSPFIDRADPGERGR